MTGAPVEPREPDESVQLHGCVGPLRQVEVVRDAVLHALADDPGLDPSDVVVLCADLPTFAPYLEAVLGDPQGAPSLPYVIRDRTVSRAVPLVAALDTAMRLVAGRVPRSAVLDLLRLDVVQRRFSMSVEDVDRITEWATTTEVRWGLDGAHREVAGLPATFDAGTWRRTLDRLVAGVALPDGAGAETLSVRAVDVGHSFERVGALCDLVEALGFLRDDATAPRSILAWCDFARAVTSSLFATSPLDREPRRELDRLLEELERDASGIDAELPFPEFRALLADRSAQVRDLVVTGPGGVTVTSFAPLRNVPFRVVALLGVDETSMERGQAQDIAFGAPRVGDRDPRTDLRASLLAALLSARDRLIVTYEAHDVVSNEVIPPCTVLAELREALGRVCTSVEDLTSEHPRHAHGDEDLLAVRGAFGFDRGALRRAIELREPLPGEDAIRAVLPAPAPPPPERVELGALGTFLQAPQREYLRLALNARLPRGAQPLDDELPTSLDDLQRWQAVKTLTIDALDTLVGSTEDAEWDRFARAWASAPDGPLSTLPGACASGSS